MGSITYEIVPGLRLIELIQRYARDGTFIPLLRSADHAPDLMGATPGESDLGSAMPVIVDHLAVNNWFSLNADLITCGPQSDSMAENPGLR